jgi:hypothetical protein
MALQLVTAGRSQGGAAVPAVGRLQGRPGASIREKEATSRGVLLKVSKVK